MNQMLLTFELWDLMIPLAPLCEHSMDGERTHRGEWAPSDHILVATWSIGPHHPDSWNFLVLCLISWKWPGKWLICYDLWYSMVFSWRFLLLVSCSFSGRYKRSWKLMPSSSWTKQAMIHMNRSSVILESIDCAHHCHHHCRHQSSLSIRPQHGPSLEFASTDEELSDSKTSQRLKAKGARGCPLCKCCPGNEGY